MFRIGEFSRIAQVSGRLLRYYDEIGLLSPETTDPWTGYRYYSARQLPRLNRILVLKELGLSLDQIARLLERNTSAEEIKGMLTLRKAEIEQSVHAEMERLRVVETRLQQIDALQEADVVLKSVPAQKILSLRETVPGMDGTQNLVRKIYTVVSSSMDSDSLGNIAIILHSPLFDPESLDVEVGYLITDSDVPPTIKISEERTLSLRELPAVDTMGTIAHVGTIGEIHRSYAALANWVEQHRWEIIGTSREIMMQLPIAGPNAQAVVEIQFPISRNS